MPNLRQLLEVVESVSCHQGFALDERALCAIARAIRLAYGGQRIYVPPIDSRKDPERREALRRAARRLPTGVAAEVTGVSASYLYRVRKEKK